MEAAMETSNNRSAVNSRTEADLELERRALAHPKFGQSPYTDLEHLRRFVIARNKNVDAAFTMWERWAAWYSEYQPEAIELEHVQPMLATGKLMVGGKDREGRGVLYVKLSNHHPSSGQTAQSIRAAVYCIEQAVRMSKASGGDGYISVIWDHQGCGLGNMDSALLIGKGGLVQVLQDFYPERLTAIHILNADWVFETLWKVVCPFLDDRTRGKIRMLKRPSDLQAVMDADELLPQYREMVFGPASSTLASTARPAPPGA